MPSPAYSICTMQSSLCDYELAYILFMYFLLYYDHLGFFCPSLKCMKKSAGMFLFPDEYTSPG
jgi:hypothetical protein